MIKDFEFYHGVVIRELVTAIAPAPVSISVEDRHGRLNAFKINEQVGLYIKHSSKRLGPWQFTFDDDSCSEIEWLAERLSDVWIALVCGHDGFLCLTREEFLVANSPDEDATSFIRVDRDKRSMYRVNGSSGPIGGAKPRGFARLIETVNGG